MPAAWFSDTTQFLTVLPSPLTKMPDRLLLRAVQPMTEQAWPVMMPTPSAVPADAQSRTTQPSPQSIPPTITPPWLSKALHAVTVQFELRRIPTALLPAATQLATVQPAPVEIPSDPLARAVQPPTELPSPTSTPALVLPLAVQWLTRPPPSVLIPSKWFPAAEHAAINVSFPARIPPPPLAEQTQDLTVPPLPIARPAPPLPEARRWSSLLLLAALACTPAMRQPLTVPFRIEMFCCGDGTFTPAPGRPPKKMGPALKEKPLRSRLTLSASINGFSLSAGPIFFGGLPGAGV